MEHPDWKKRSKTVFLNDILLDIETSKETTKQLLELISEFSRVVGYKINAHTQNKKLSCILYTNTEQSKKN